MKIIYVNFGERDKYGSDLRITQSLQYFQASYMLMTQCTILHFGNLAGAVWQHVSNLASWYLHYAVLSDVCCEMRRRWVDFFINKRKIFKTVNL